MKSYENLFKSNGLQQVNRIVLKGRCKAITISSSTKKRHRKNIFQCWRTCRGCKGQRPLARGSNGGGATFASVRAAVATAHGLLLLPNADFRKKFVPSARLRSQCGDRFGDHIAERYHTQITSRQTLLRPIIGIALNECSAAIGATPTPKRFSRRAMLLAETPTTWQMSGYCTSNVQILQFRMANPYIRRTHAQRHRRGNDSSIWIAKS